MRAALAWETLAELKTLPARAGIDGCVGDALFACALNQIAGGIDVDFWLARAIRTTNARPPGPSLHYGVAGLGFVLALYADAEELLCTIDSMLLGCLAKVPPASLQSGVAGIALYSSLRAQAETGQRLQRATIAALANAAQPTGDGLVWHTPADYALRRGVAIQGEPITEFGVVHGIAGALVGLAALAQCGHTDAARLARAGLQALWSCERAAPNHFGRIHFGRDGSAGTYELDGRWCVGDVGVLRACWIAAKVVADEVSAARARAHLMTIAQEHAGGATAGEPGRLDLCCGASVIAQVYLRMYWETGESIFRLAHQRLLERCFRDIAGMSAKSFRFGSAGVLLALLAPRVNADPIWDSILGISLPRRHQLR
jgi:hypothetical protein